jgi:hypothetical protein
MIPAHHITSHQLHVTKINLAISRRKNSNLVTLCRSVVVIDPFIKRKQQALIAVSALDHGIESAHRGDDTGFFA